jgi:hypothetical protein
MVNLTPQDTVEHVLWNGSQWNQLINNINSGSKDMLGFSAKKVEKAKLLAMRIKDGLASLSKKTPLSQGWVTPHNGKIGLTIKGWQVVNTTPTAYMQVTKERILSNKPLWFVRYHFPSKPSFGKDLWRVVMPSFSQAMRRNSKGDYAKSGPEREILMLEGLRRLQGMLVSRLRAGEIEEMIADVDESTNNLFPIKSSSLEQMQQAYQAMDKACTELSVYDEQEPIDDAAEFNGDDGLDLPLIDQLIGAHLVSQHVSEKICGLTLQLHKVKREIKGRDPQEVWEEVVHPLVERFLSEINYSPNVDYVNQSLTEDEKVAEQEAMPWDTPMFSETPVISRFERRPVAFDIHSHEPVQFEVVKTSQVQEKKLYNLDDVDFGVENYHAALDRSRERAAKLLIALLKFPQFCKTQFEQGLPAEQADMARQRRMLASLEHFKTLMFKVRTITREQKLLKA